MQALCKSCRLLFVLRWNLFFVSSSPHFIRAFGGAVGIPFDWWDSFTLNFFLLLPDFIRFASGYHDPREANGCFFSLVANPENQRFLQVSVPRNSLFFVSASPSPLLQPICVHLKRICADVWICSAFRFCAFLPFLSHSATFSFCFYLTFFSYTIRGALCLFSLGYFRSTCIVQLYPSQKCIPSPLPHTNGAVELHCTPARRFPWGENEKSCSFFFWDTVEVVQLMGQVCVEPIGWVQQISRAFGLDHQNIDVPWQSDSDSLRPRQRKGKIIFAEKLNFRFLIMCRDFSV